MTTLALGVDLGSSGLRIALVEPGGERLVEEASPYPTRLEDPWSWVNGLVLLCARLPSALRSRVGAIAIAGTSGTLLLCRPDGQPAPGALGLALPYHRCCAGQARAAAALAADGPAASASGSLARALHLLAEAEHSGAAGPWLLRHQADWLMGWLLGNWRRGEEGNNLRLGWDLQRQRWSGTIALQPWASGLPEICTSGACLGLLAPPAAACLGLPPSAQVVAGSTDANAGVLAAEPRSGDGITVLGTTLVLKQFSPKPIEGAGISCHRVAGRWHPAALLQRQADRRTQPSDRSQPAHGASAAPFAGPRGALSSGRSKPGAGAGAPPDQRWALPPGPAGGAHRHRTGWLEAVARGRRPAPGAGDHPGGRCPKPPVAPAAATEPDGAGAEPPWAVRGPRHGQTGGNNPSNAMNDRLRSVISMGIFVLLAGYVGFSAIRLGILLWQRFGAG
jgi:sugar (pentulose or hexulose) kinase